MEPFKRTENQAKILKSMDIVWEKLVEEKRRTNSELIIMQDGKIVRIKP